MKGRNVEVLLERLEAKHETQHLVLVYRTEDLNGLAEQVGSGARDLTRLLVLCAADARLQTRHKEDPR